MSKPKSDIPRHVAIIMDGNRRWAKQQGWKGIRGHQKVANEVIEELVDHAIEKKIEFLTLWAFSTENWNRPKHEVEGILQLFRTAFAKSAEDLHQKGVKLGVIGDMTRFPDDIQRDVDKWIEISKQNTKITVTFALNYGGHDELLRMMKGLVQDELQPEELTEEMISRRLDTRFLPDVDYILRPGGEQRLSGFMPWQAIYAEYYFTDTLMPDFTAEKFEEALEEYSQRQRRFGK